LLCGSAGIELKRSSPASSCFRVLVFYRHDQKSRNFLFSSMFHRLTIVRRWNILENKVLLTSSS